MEPREEMMVIDNTVRSFEFLFRDGCVSTPAFPTEQDFKVHDLFGGTE